MRVVGGTGAVRVVLQLDVTGRVETPDVAGWPQCRVLVDDAGKAAVWHGQRGGNVLVWSGRVDEVESRAPAGRPVKEGPWVLVAADGTVLTAYPGGCGCGTRLSALGENDLKALVVAA